MESTETTLPVPEAEAVRPDPAGTGAAPPAAVSDAHGPNPDEVVHAALDHDTMAGSLDFQSEAPVVAPQLYQFAQSSLLTAPELRKLRADHTEFLASLAARLGIYFRMEFELTLVSLQTLTFRQFVSGLSQPTHLTLFKVEPLRSISVLEISPAFALAMTDRLMGGPGEAVAAAHELSEIEVALLDQVAQFILDGWCGQWRQRQELKSTLLGHESDARYLQTSRPDSAMLVATMNARLGQGSGQIQLAIPFATLEPLLQKLRAELQPAAEAVPEALVPAQVPWNPTFNDVKIAITAELPGPYRLIRAIPQLKVGELLELPVDSVNHVELRLGGRRRFTGRLGTRDNYWAVEVTAVAKT
jgi:flagellar motor switch protein FliM